MTVKFILLGTGSSMGVPRADGYAGNCDLKNKKNFRTRCSGLIKFSSERDTSSSIFSCEEVKGTFSDKLFYIGCLT